MTKADCKRLSPEYTRDYNNAAKTREVCPKPTWRCPNQDDGPMRCQPMSCGGLLIRPYWSANHLEESLLDQAQARASYTPPFWGSFA